MVVRSPLPVVLCVFAACHSAVVPSPASGLQDGLLEARAEIALLTQLVLARSPDAIAVLPESPTMAELAACLATLNDHLAALRERLTVSSGAAAAVEATAERTAQVLARSAADARCCAALQQALQAREQERQVIVENCANTRTVGYKRRSLELTMAPDAVTGAMLETAGRIVWLMTPGALEPTDRSLDVAIDGEGFFAVALADGSTRYTRAGALQCDAGGRLLTAAGHVVLPGITLANDTLEVAISPDGCVTGRTACSPDTVTSFGQLTLTRFREPSALCDAGGVLRASDGAGAPCTGAPGSRGLGVLKQGFLERSNVQLHNEVVHLQVVDRQISVLRRLLAGYGVFVR